MTARKHGQDAPAGDVGEAAVTAAEVLGGVVGPFATAGGGGLGAVGGAQLGEAVARTLQAGAADDQPAAEAEPEPPYLYRGGPT